eukprot:11106678-Alexandrium_andersonii.AAC.1
MSACAMYQRSQGGFVDRLRVRSSLLRVLSMPLRTGANAAPQSSTRSRTSASPRRRTTASSITASLRTQGRWCKYN